MKTKTKKYLTSGLALMFLLTTGAGFITAQQKDEPSPQRDKPTNQEKQQLKTHGSMRGLSSSSVDQDEGFSIAAIRRVRTTYKKLVNRVPTYMTVLKVVIEMHVSRMPDVTNAFDYLIIGDKLLGYGRCSDDDDYCIRSRLTPEQFEQLRDNSIVSIYKGAPIDSEALKEQYKNGEPSEVLGIKFGRLHKELIDQFPMVERSVVSPY